MNNYIEYLKTPSQDNKYYKWYSNICQRAMQRNISAETYTELHHILPKSVFPEFQKDNANLVKLTAREHFICHWLLTKIIKDKRLIYAFGMMIPSKTNNRYRPKSSIVYEQLKRMCSNAKRGPRGGQWFTNGVENYFTKDRTSVPAGYYPGRSFSTETRNKISKKASGRMHTQDTKEKMSLDRKGRQGVPHSAFTKLKLSRSHSGMTHSDETKQKMRDAKLGKKRGPYKTKSKDSVSA